MPRAWLLLAAVLLCAACQPKPPPPTSFVQALQAMPLGPRPAEAWFLVDLLARSGEPQQVEQSEHLRRALWQWQLALLRGEPAPPPMTLQSAVAQGTTLPAVATLLAAQWDRTFRAASKVVFDDPADPPRLPWQSARNLAPGLWAQEERPGGPVYFSLDVRLQGVGSQSTLADGLRLRFGDAADALVLACRPSGHRRTVPAVVGTVQTTASVPILACTGTGGARWESLLPVLLMAARQGGAPPQLLPVPPDPAQPGVEAKLWAAWGSASLAPWPLLAEWKRSREPALARHSWTSAARALQPPTATPPPPTFTERLQAELRAAWLRVKPLVMMACLGFFAFAVVRVTMPHASPPARSRVSFVLCMVIALPVMYSVVDLRSGDGWARLGQLGIGFAVLQGAFTAAVMAVALHLLHGLLDAADITWTHTVASGWRRMLQLVGGATRAEFWGFFAFAMGVRAVAVAVALGPPWTNILTLVVALPLGTLLLRRMQAMTIAEWLAVLGYVAVHVLNAVLPV